MYSRLLNGLEVTQRALEVVLCSRQNKCIKLYEHSVPYGRTPSQESIQIL